MTSIFHPQVRVERSFADVAVAILCVVAVGIAALFHRKTGACGTAHYLFFQLLGGMVVSIMEELAVATRFDTFLASVLAYVLNVGLFSVLVRAWYRRAPKDRYVIGALGITIAYLASYFFLLPTMDCP